MGLFQSDNPKEKQHQGILGAFSVDVIKWEPETDQEAAIIVHKFQYEDFPNGSYLIVAPSQMAIFTNNLAAGSSTDADGAGQSQVSIFTGPCKIKLETGDSRFAPFRNVGHALTGGESAFHSTVYFVNTTYMNELSWGTHDPILIQDPEEEVNIHVRANGLFGAHIDQTDTGTAAVQARKFLQKVVGTRADYERKELLQFMRAKILEYVPNLLSQNMVEKQIGILKINSHLSEFSQIIYEKLIGHFDEFGLTLDNFSFHSINVPDEDLREINEMKIQRKRDRLEAEGHAAKMDIESEAMARKRAREGYTYQQEQAFGVMGTAAANEGTSSNFLGAGMGLGMGVGMGGALGAGMGALAQETIGNVSTATPSQTEPKLICPSCKASVPTGAKFCLNCGEKMVEELRCPDCGAALTKGAKFCMNCGKKLVSVCPNCGAELVSGAKFCLECGTKV